MTVTTRLQNMGANIRTNYQNTGVQGKTTIWLLLTIAFSALASTAMGKENLFLNSLVVLFLVGVIYTSTQTLRWFVLSVLSQEQRSRVVGLYDQLKNHDKVSLWSAITLVILAICWVTLLSEYAPVSGAISSLMFSWITFFSSLPAALKTYQWADAR